MILVFGSINADFFLSVKSLPRPGETVLCPSYTFYPGGKGANQAVAAARLGGEVMFVGSIGDDPCEIHKWYNRNSFCYGRRDWRESNSCCKRSKS